MATVLRRFVSVSVCLSVCYRVFCDYTQRDNKLGPTRSLFSIRYFRGPAISFDFLFQHTVTSYRQAISRMEHASVEKGEGLGTRLNHLRVINTYGACARGGGRRRLGIYEATLFRHCGARHDQLLRVSSCTPLRAR